jgi:hypothetical protein
MRANRATMDRRFFGVFGCVFCKRLGVGLGIGWGFVVGVVCGVVVVVGAVGSRGVAL